METRDCRGSLGLRARNSGATFSLNGRTELKPMQKRGKRSGVRKEDVPWSQRNSQCGKNSPRYHQDRSSDSSANRLGLKARVERNGREKATRPMESPEEG